MRPIDLLISDVIRDLLGKLIYLTLTRPDISYVVGMVSQFMHNRTTKHLETTFHIVRYLKKSLDQGLLYCRRHDFRVETFTDADWARSVTDMRSTSGYCTFVGGVTLSLGAARSS